METAETVGTVEAVEVEVMVETVGTVEMEVMLETVVMVEMAGAVEMVEMQVEAVMEVEAAGEEMVRLFCVLLSLLSRTLVL